MFSRTEVEMLIDDLCEEQALVIGGLVAVHGIDDSFVWKLIESLDAIRVKALRQLKERNAPETPKALGRRLNLQPHPAIQGFIQKLRRA